MASNLYFIAVLPDKSLQEKITVLKREFQLKYKASHALKSPPHITLVMPFRRPEIFEDQLIKALEDFSRKQRSFEVILKGFDGFEPRVVFIRIEHHEALKELHQKLRSWLLNSLGFAEKEIQKHIHPHLTLATRDLKPEFFYKARDDFFSREFSEQFKVEGLWLLKHNGKNWDVYKYFKFGVKTS